MLRLILAVLLVSLAWAVQAQQAKLTPAEREAKARGYFTDTKLKTQADRTVRFYSDALKDKVVLINFVFTQCGDACPLITAKLVHAKKEPGAVCGHEGRFVPISTVPQHDRPQDTSPSSFFACTSFAVMSGQAS